jgi:negative regulator of replication initiation
VDRDAYHYAKDDTTMGGDDLQDILVRMPSLREPSDFKEACVNAQSCAVLIQHIKDADSLFAKLHTQTFVSNDLLYVLFQIYMPLSALRYEFTHYDLHTRNVILYEPVKGSYIQYHYHMEGGNVVSFKSAYIAKIIDYGRCFFEDSENESFYGSSTKIHHELCKLSECKPNCGKNVGFYWLSPFDRDKTKRYYINSLVRNMSHDLRLFNETKSAHISQHAKDIYQLKKTLKFNAEYGTKEETDSGISKNRIQNVNDLERKLQELIVNPMNIDHNNAVYASKTKLGDMHVYCDGRPLEYMASV